MAPLTENTTPFAQKRTTEGSGTLKPPPAVRQAAEFRLSAAGSGKRVFNWMPDKLGA